MGVPGWPELACCTASIDRVRMVLMQVWSRIASDAFPQPDRPGERLIVAMEFVVIQQLLAISARYLLRPEKPPPRYNPRLDKKFHDSAPTPAQRSALICLLYTSDAADEEDSVDF